jgi:hypothetical protein
MNMKQIPSCLAILAAVAVISFPIMGGPIGWHERLLDPATFLTALAFAGVGMVIWPLPDSNAASLKGKVRSAGPEIRSIP